MLILLPPSEGKAAPTRGKVLDLAGLSFPELSTARAEVLDAVAALSERDDAAEVLGLGPSLIGEIDRNAHLRQAATARVDRIYTGVLYDALDLGTVEAAAHRRATRWLAVTSSVFGLVRPADRIPAYRLPGGTTLPTLPGHGGVAAHWRKVLGPVVDAAAGSGLVVDLRSSVYAGFWRPEPEHSAQVASVRVLHETGGRRTVVSHFNKATKGRIVRAVLERGTDARTPEAFANLLGELGWVVETGAPGRYGLPLDVIVHEL